MATQSPSTDRSGYPVPDYPMYYVVQVQEGDKTAFAVCQRIFSVDPSRDLPDVPGGRREDFERYIDRNCVPAAAVPKLLQVAMFRSGHWRSGSPD